VTPGRWGRDPAGMALWSQGSFARLSKTPTVSSRRRRFSLSGGQSGSLSFRSSLKLWGQLLDRVALSSDHMASTSVPGLRANDVIDAPVVVATWDAERVVPALAGLGFEQRTTPWNLRDHVPAGGSEA
jgi:GrpB protein